MRYMVLAFYSHSGLKVRHTEYSNKREMYEYINGLVACGTPYFAGDKKTGQVIGHGLFDSNPKEIAKILEEELNKEDDE